MFDNLITDRTLLDYRRWLELRNKGFDNMTEAERAEWGTDMKGAYNASDLNRVGAVLNYMRDKLAAAGYVAINAFNMKTAWTTADIPTVQEFSAYLAAVATIRGALAQWSTTPPVPEDVGGLDYQGANDIEQILLDVEELTNLMLAARYYGGDLYGGEI